MTDDLLSPEISERHARLLASLARQYGGLLRTAIVDVFGENRVELLYPAALMLLADEAARGPLQ